MEHVVQELYAFWFLNVTAREEGGKKKKKSMLEIMTEIGILPETLLQGLCLDVIERQKSFRLEILLLEVLNALASSFLRVHDDGFHVFTQNFCDGDVVALVNGLAHVVHTIVLRCNERNN